MIGPLSLVNKTPETLLVDVYPEWKSNNALFDKFQNTPWDEDVDGKLLNLQYFGNHSGRKFCSPLVMEMIDSESGTLETLEMTTIADLILATYGRQWQHLWDTYDIEYSPLDNYDITEKIDREVDDTGTDAMGYGKTTTTTHGKTVTTTYGKVTTTTHGKTETSTDYVNGFNSVTAPGPESQRNVNTESGTTPIAETGTSPVVESGTTPVAETGTDTRTKNLKTEEDTTIHRYGKLGSVTPQYMIKEDRSLWIWNFFEQLFRDCDEILTLAYHDPCAV